MPHSKAKSMLLDRLGGLHSKFELGGKDMLVAHVTAGKVFVFVVWKEDGLMFDDDVALFPSDRLVTQLRLALT